MGIVFRQSVKTTMVILAGAVLGAIVNFGYVYVLSKQAVGFTRMMFAQASILQFLVNFGTGGMVLTFIQRYNDRHKQKVILSMAALAPMVICGILLIPYHLLRNNVIGFYQPGDAAIAGQYYYWIPVLVLLWALMTQMESYLNTQHKTAVSSFMREVLLKLLNVGLIVLMWFRLVSFPVFVIASILFYAVPTIIMWPIAKKTPAFGFSTNWKVLNKGEYKELLHFSWYHLLMGMSVYALGQLDTLMLGTLSKSGLAAVAVYATAVFITTVMTAPYRAMATASFPALNAVYLTNDMEQLRALFKRSSINMLIVAVAMTIIVGCNLHNAVALLPKGKGFEAIVPLVLIMMIGRLIDMATGLNTELISISRYYKFNFYIAIVLVALMALFNLLLIPRFDIYGAAWGTTIALVLFNVGKMFFLWRKLGILPFSKESVVILFAGIVTAGAGYFFPLLPHFILDTIVRTVVVVAVFTGMLLWLKPSEDLRTYLKSINEKKRLF